MLNRRASPAEVASDPDAMELVEDTWALLPEAPLLDIENLSLSKTATCSTLIWAPTSDDHFVLRALLRYSAIEMADAGSSRGAAARSISDLKAPLWDFVTTIEKTVTDGGNVRWRCNFYSLEKLTSYTRVEAHLLKKTSKGITVCNKVTIDDLSQMRRAIAAAAAELDRSKAKSVSLPTSNNNKRQSGPPTELEKVWKMDQRNHMDSLIARSFYSGGIAFNFARNPCLQEAFTYACSNDLKGYKMPGYNKLRTTLLKKERAHIERSTDGYKKGDTRMWDVGGDSFDSFSGVGILEVANLSIDQPELQAVSFGDVEMELVDDNDANATKLDEKRIVSYCMWSCMLYVLYLFS
ncbi:hypothetical protein PR202_gb16940 [Eleusine coracana subsp. coracana]|uniref:Uncharacterized protein n=1 Tax=Eleusine coracana subsp. coracana TaxID=191504 RepID=A0AAV5F1P5_ELECO|nr:hypothetical protein PR202_gb16940 [Eleusine coracana subsp. coracana]